MTANPKLRRLGARARALYPILAVLLIYVCPQRSTAQTAGDRSSTNYGITYDYIKKIYPDSTISLHAKAHAADVLFRSIDARRQGAPLDDTTAYLADYAGAAYLISGDTLRAQAIVTLALARAPQDTTGTSRRFKFCLSRLYWHKSKMHGFAPAGQQETSPFISPAMELAYRTAGAAVALTLMAMLAAKGFAARARKVLRAEIKRQGRKQAELAEVWGYDSLTSVSNILTGKVEVTFRQFGEACEYLGVDPMRLLVGKQAEADKPSFSFIQRMNGQPWMRWRCVYESVGDIVVDANLESELVYDPESVAERDAKN